MHPTRTLTFCCLALMALAALSKQALASSSATVASAQGPEPTTLPFKRR